MLPPPLCTHDSRGHGHVEALSPVTVAAVGGYAQLHGSLLHHCLTDAITLITHHDDGMGRQLSIVDICSS